MWNYYNSPHLFSERGLQRILIAFVNKREEANPLRSSPLRAVVEATGVEPVSENPLRKLSTSVAYLLDSLSKTSVSRLLR